MGYSTEYTGEMTFQPALTSEQLQQVARCGITLFYTHLRWKSEWPCHNWKFKETGFTYAGEGDKYYDDYATASLCAIWEWCRENNITLRGHFLWRHELAPHAEGKLEATPSGIKCYTVKEVEYVFNKPTNMQLGIYKEKMNFVESHIKEYGDRGSVSIVDEQMTWRGTDRDEMDALEYVRNEKRKQKKQSTAPKPLLIKPGVKKPESSAPKPIIIPKPESAKKPQPPKSPSAPNKRKLDDIKIKNILQTCIRLVLLFFFSIY